MKSIGQQIAQRWADAEKEREEAGLPPPEPDPEAGKKMGEFYRERLRPALQANARRRAESMARARLGIPPSVVRKLTK